MTDHFTIPPLAHPQRYTGLYVIRFAHGTVAGYVAEEVAMLLRASEHADATAYRIHRVDERGCLELIGVRLDDLTGESVMLLTRSDPALAADDFATLRQIARDTPPPCAVRLEHLDLPQPYAAHAVGLIYPQHASTMLGRWLVRSGFAGGDQVYGGLEAQAARAAALAKPVAVADLAIDPHRQPRTWEVVSAAIREPVQRQL
jgi:hypothetical protein